MCNSPEHMQIEQKIVHQLKEAAVILLTYGPLKMQEWWGRRPFVRILRREIDAAVRTGKLAGPSTRYYVSANISRDFVDTRCFVVDRERIDEYTVDYLEQTSSKKGRAVRLSSMTDSLTVLDETGQERNVQFQDVTFLGGPATLLDEPTLKVMF
jgi:hypothetical protein